MKKSINLWAFPYPGRMTLRECLQLAKDAGFDGIELNYDLDNDLSPKSGAPVSSDSQDGRRDRHRDQRPLLVPLLALFPHRQRPRPAQRGARAGQAHDRGRPRAGHGEPADDRRLNLHSLAPRSRAGADRRLRPRAREAIGKLLPTAEKLGVYLNIENIFFNGYLTTPDEMNAFVDSFGSKHVRVHFDTGNVMLTPCLMCSVNLLLGET